MTTLPKFLMVSLSAVVLLAPAVHAQDRGTGHERPPAEQKFRSPHWVLDRRFHHDHYYPAPGYVVAALPAGHIAITFGGAPFYFQGGVWFRPARGGFVVVTPPAGIVVPILPPAYSTLWIGGVPYYYANDIFYATAPARGYMVVGPPPGVENATVQAIEGGGPPAPPMSPPMASPPAPAAPATAYWYYCPSAQTYYPNVPTCPEPWVKVPPTPQQVPVAPPRS